MNSFFIFYTKVFFLCLFHVESLIKFVCKMFLKCIRYLNLIILRYYIIFVFISIFIIYIICNFYFNPHFMVHADHPTNDLMRLVGSTRDTKYNFYPWVHPPLSFPAMNSMSVRDKIHITNLFMLNDQFFSMPIREKLWVSYVNSPVFNYLNSMPPTEDFYTDRNLQLIYDLFYRDVVRLNVSLGLNYIYPGADDSDVFNLDYRMRLYIADIVYFPSNFWGNDSIQVLIHFQKFLEIFIHDAKNVGYIGVDTYRHAYANISLQIEQFPSGSMTKAAITESYNAAFKRASAFKFIKI